MIIIPSLKSHTVARPGKPVYEELYQIPNDDVKFWNNIYRELRSLDIRSPVIRNINNYVNSDHGHFGYRIHPVTKESRYYHGGVSLDLKGGRNIYPVARGVLEYSGYGAVNGHYVLLSHPQIQTEDGYILHSMYCHLKKPLVKFNSYQKMLREISLGSYPIIEIENKVIVGKAGVSGVSRDNHPGLFLQFSFRKFDERPIVVDPWRFYNVRNKNNTTA